MKYQYIQGLLDTPHPTGKIPLTVQVGRQAGKVLRRGCAISTTREYRPGNKPQGHCPEYPVWHVHSKANRPSELYSNGSPHRWKMGLICASWSHRQVIACSRVWPWCTGCYKHCSIITTWISDRVGLRTLPVIHGGRYRVRLQLCENVWWHRSKTGDKGRSQSQQSP
jgi:hypothetical protein